MTWSAIQTAAATDGLIIMGNVTAGDGSTTVLLGTGPSFWPMFTASKEYDDGVPHPVDRWSKRVIRAMAANLDATTSFPSEGPPYAPFIRWSMESGRFFQSPVGMMVHDQVGMMISLRGALHFTQALVGLAPDPNAASGSPCVACDAPCAVACPVGALSANAPYDVSGCHDFLDTEAGKPCMVAGCAARRACPVSDGAQRASAQSALHMRSFHPGKDII